MSATGEAWGAEAGTTLLEMLVVVALLAMTSGLVFANFRPALDRVVLGAARTQFASALIRTRARAIREATPQRLNLASDGYVAMGRRVTLQPGLRLESDQPSVVFSPDGRSAGARMWLVRGARRLGVTVAPGSGLVTAGPGA